MIRLCLYYLKGHCERQEASHLTSQARIIKPRGFSSARYVLSAELLRAHGSATDKPQAVGLL